MSAEPSALAEILATGTINEKVAALARLDATQYDQLRKIVADNTGMRVGTLDSEVAKLRRPASSSGISFADVEPCPEPVDGSELLDLISKEIRNYLVIQEAASAAIALWLVLTWSVEATFVLPMLAISSPQKRCGKSTLLILLRKIARKALLVSNTSPAAIFRIVEKHAPTLLLDEAETWMNENEELRGIINSGHSRDTASVLRVDGDAFEPKVFSTFCPKALAGIGRLADTIEDRSITIEMRRRSPDETVGALRQDRLNLEWLQRLCARWSRDNLQALIDADPHVPPELHDRAADNWRPLLRIADLAGGDWPTRARSASVVLTIKDGDKDSIQALLLSDIRDILDSRPKLKSTELAAALTEIEDHPWAEWKHGKAMTAVQLARQLAPFDIRPKPIRFTDFLVAKGYDIHQFDDTFSRYLPKNTNRTVTELQTLKYKGLNGNEAVTENSDVTVRNGYKNFDVTDENVKNTGNSGVCNHVTDQSRKTSPGNGKTLDHLQLGERIRLMAQRHNYSAEELADELARAATDPDSSLRWVEQDERRQAG
jgi:putative DNA primase/helicase